MEPTVPQTTQFIAKAIGCSPQTDGRTLLWKTTPAKRTEHGEVGLVPTQSLRPLLTRVHATGKYSVCYQRSKASTSPSVYSADLH